MLDDCGAATHGTKALHVVLLLGAWEAFQSLNDFKVAHHPHAFVFELMTVHDVQAAVTIKPNQHIHSFSVIE